MFYIMTYPSIKLLKRFRLISDQIHFIGNYSLIITITCGFFIGCVLSLQGYHILSKYGAEQTLGLLIALILTRELGPVVTALLFAGRVGTSLTTEIGLMKVHDQLLAMEMMAIDPVQRIIMPRFLASIISMPILTIIFNTFGIIGGYIVSVKLLNIDEGAFLSQMQEGVNILSDIFNGILKSLIFSVVIAFVAVLQGYNSQSTPEGVAQATTRTVVIASLAILGLDFLLTGLMFS